MLVDLDSLRPKNETYEHFILKQVGRAWLFKKGLRYVSCEVGLEGQDSSPYGRKKIVDVVGVERKRKQQPSKTKMYNKIYEVAIEIGKPLGLTKESWNGKYSFINTFSLRGEERAAKDSSIELCFEKACESLGLDREVYKKLRNPYKEEYLLVSLECKQSLQDFRKGFSVTGDHAYILVPKDLVSLNELPNKMGLLEFDFDKFHETKDWEVSLQVKKKPRKHYDSMFLKDFKDPNSVDLDYHAQFCRELVFSICQESTEETIFWNPFLRHIPDGISHSPELSYRFKFKAGDETPLGIIIDRRIGKKTPEDIASENSYYTGSYTEFYKLVVGGRGITDWISTRVIEDSISNT